LDYGWRCIPAISPIILGLVGIPNNIGIIRIIRILHHIPNIDPLYTHCGIIHHIRILIRIIPAMD
jgi:hypothetical protein